MPTPPKDLKFTAPKADPPVPTQLPIVIENASGLDYTSEDLPIIELQLPKSIASSDLTDAAASADFEYSKLVSVDDLVTVEGGRGTWNASVHADSDGSQGAVRVWLLSGSDLDSPGSLPNGERLTVTLPIVPDERPANGKAATVDLDFQYGGYVDVFGAMRLDSDTATPASLEDVELPSNATEPPADPPVDPPADPPVVLFWTDQPDDELALGLGDSVKLFWRIESCTLATLHGPLGPGKASLELEPRDGVVENAGYPVRAVGTKIYTLDATLEDGSRVVRSITLNTVGDDGYGASSVQPTSVLPNGDFEVHWTAWGVRTARVVVTPIGAGNARATSYTVFPAPDPSGKVQPPEPPFVGQSGTLELTAPSKGLVSIHLDLVPLDPGAPATTTEARTVAVETWSERSSDLPGEGGALSLAFAQDSTKGVLALCKTDGVFITDEVGLVDSGDTEPPPLRFERCTALDAGTAQWYAVAAMPGELVGLRRATSGDLELVRFDLDGENPTTLDLPDTWDLRRAYLPSATGRDDAWAELVWVAPRLVITGGARDERASRGIRWVPTPLAVDFSDPDSPKIDGSFRIGSVSGFPLVPMAGDLYALEGSTGSCRRLSPTGPTGPYTASNAEEVDPDDGSEVPIGSGADLVTSVGDLLLALGGEPTEKGWAYDRRVDTWYRCGSGPGVPGGFAAFRGGTSPRMWVCSSSPEDAAGERIYTISLPALERSFLPHYMAGDLGEPALEPSLTISATPEVRCRAALPLMPPGTTGILDTPEELMLQGLRLSGFGECATAAYSVVTGGTGQIYLDHASGGYPSIQAMYRVGNEEHRLPDGRVLTVVVNGGAGPSMPGDLSVAGLVIIDPTTGHNEYPQPEQVGYDLVLSPDRQSLEFRQRDLDVKVHWVLGELSGRIHVDPAGAPFVQAPAEVRGDFDLSISYERGGAPASPPDIFSIRLDIVDDAGVLQDTVRFDVDFTKPLGIRQRESGEDHTVQVEVASENVAVSSVALVEDGTMTCALGRAPVITSCTLRAVPSASGSGKEFELTWESAYAESVHIKIAGVDGLGAYPALVEFEGRQHEVNEVASAATSGTRRYTMPAHLDEAALVPSSMGVTFELYASHENYPVGPKVQASYFPSAEDIEPVELVASKVQIFSKALNHPMGSEAEDGHPTLTFGEGVNTTWDVMAYGGEYSFSQPGCFLPVDISPYGKWGGTSRTYLPVRFCPGGWVVFLPQNSSGDSCYELQGGAMVPGSDRCQDAWFRITKLS